MSQSIYLRRDIANIARAAVVASDPPASLILDAGELDAATQTRILDAYQVGFMRAVAVFAFSFGLVRQDATEAQVWRVLRELPRE